MYSKISNVDKLFSKYKGKTVTALWSGGLDSTFLVMMLIRAKVRYIELLVIDYTNRPSVMQERHARELLLPEIQSAAGAHGVSVETVTLTGTMPANGFRYAQLAWWAHLAPLATASTVDYVLIGYVAGDRGPLYRKEIHALFKSSAALRALPDDKLPVLEFPLERVEKQEIAACLYNPQDPVNDKMGKLFAAMRAYTHCCETSVSMVPHIGSECRCPSCNRHYIPDSVMVGLGANADLSDAIAGERNVFGPKITWDMWLKMHPQYTKLCCQRKLVWGLYDGYWYAIGAGFDDGCTTMSDSITTACAPDDMDASNELHYLLEAKFGESPHEPKVGDFVPVDNAILKIAAREKAKLSSVSEDVDVELAGC